MRVLNFGSLNIDHVYRVDHIVAPGETLAALSLDFAAGGKGLNQSIALAKAGVETYHAGCLGTDGGWLRQMLEDSGVDTRHLIDVDTVNGHAIIQVNKDAQNCIIIHGGSNQAITKEQIDTTLAQFTQDTMVLLQNETSHVDYIVQRCKELNIPVAFNPSPFTPDLVERVPFEAVSYLLINETEGQAISGKEDPQEIVATLLERYPGMHVVLTLGGDGVCYAHKDQKVRQAAFRVKAVDTTAAGDTFTGFFLGSLLSGKSIEETLRYANGAAALAVTVSGAAPSIPTLEKVEAFLAEN